MSVPSAQSGVQSRSTYRPDPVAESPPQFDQVMSVSAYNPLPHIRSKVAGRATASCPQVIKYVVSAPVDPTAETSRGDASAVRGDARCATPTPTPTTAAAATTTRAAHNPV